MTLKDTLKHVAAKIDKVVTGFDDEKEKANPGELEVDPSVKASSDILPNIDHSRDAGLGQVPAPGSENQAPGHKQSRDHPLPDPTA